MLTEIKTTFQHYFKDEQGLTQGECTLWFETPWYRRIFVGKRLRLRSIFVNDLLHGKCTTWHENGLLKYQGEFFNDHIHNEFKAWYSTGQLQEHCFYIHGTRHGECKVWNENGQLWDHCFYVNGREVRFDEIPYPTTPEDRMLFILKYDLPLLPVETK